LTITYRLCKQHRDPRRSLGAAAVGARWNPPGIEVVYTSIHASLAVLEILANSDDLPDDYSLTEIHIPDKVPIEHLSNDDLPPNWTIDRPYSREAQAVGARWTNAGHRAVLSVPSKIMWPVTSERNFLLNPAHPSFRLIEFVTTQPFHFDTRLK